MKWNNFLAKQIWLHNKPTTYFHHVLKSGILLIVIFLDNRPLSTPIIWFYQLLFADSVGVNYTSQPDITAWINECVPGLSYKQNYHFLIKNNIRSIYYSDFSLNLKFSKFVMVFVCGLQIFVCFKIDISVYFLLTCVLFQAVNRRLLTSVIYVSGNIWLYFQQTCFHLFIMINVNNIYLHRGHLFPNRCHWQYRLYFSYLSCIRI